MGLAKMAVLRVVDTCHNGLGLLPLDQQFLYQSIGNDTEIGPVQDRLQVCRPGMAPLTSVSGDVASRGVPTYRMPIQRIIPIL